MGSINVQLRAIANSSHRKYIHPDLTIKTPGFLKRILWVIAGPFHSLRKAWFGVDYRSTAQHLARYQTQLHTDPALWNPTIKKLQRLNRAFRHLKPIASPQNPIVNLSGAVSPRVGAIPLVTEYHGGGEMVRGLRSPLISGTLVLPSINQPPPHYSAPLPNPQHIPNSVSVTQVNGRQGTRVIPQGEKSVVASRNTEVVNYSGQGGASLEHTNAKSKRVEDRRKTVTAVPADKSRNPSRVATPSTKPAVPRSTSSVTVHKSSASSRAPGANQVRTAVGDNGAKTLHTGRSTGGSSLSLKKP